MNRKIEEILEDLFKDENVNGFILSDERYKELKDYITELQNDKIALIKNHLSVYNDYFIKIYKLQELKQKLQKANDTLDTHNELIEKLNQENENLKNFIDNLILTFNHCELNGTKKLDIVSDYIKQEYEKALNGSDEK